MSTRWSDLSRFERDVLEERFHAAARLEAAIADLENVRAQDPAHKPVSLSLLYGYATRGDVDLSPRQREKVARDTRLSAALDRFLTNAAVAYFPRLAAASTGEHRVRKEKAGETTIRIEASRAHKDQVYLVITLGEDVDRNFSTLELRRPGRPPARLALPEPREGRVQVLLSANSEIVREYQNDAEIFLR